MYIYVYMTRYSNTDHVKKDAHVSSSDAASISAFSTLKPGSGQAGQRTARELGRR